MNTTRTRSTRGYGPGASVTLADGTRASVKSRGDDLIVRFGGPGDYVHLLVRRDCSVVVGPSRRTTHDSYDALMDLLKSPVILDAQTLDAAWNWFLRDRSKDADPVPVGVDVHVEVGSQS